MDTLIVSKTRMDSGVCVGGVTETGQSVRILTPDGKNQPFDTPLEVGDIWDMYLLNVENTLPPHTEDRKVQQNRWKSKLTHQEIINYVWSKNIPVTSGSLTELFHKKLKFTASGKAYIDGNHVPDHSTAFWLADQDLTKSENRYIYSPFIRINSSVNQVSIPFKGFQPVRDVISKGTLLRMSLARWWRPADSDIEERCYLQLSGWYECSMAIP